MIKHNRENIIVYPVFFSVKKRSEGNFHLLWNANPNWPRGSEQWPPEPFRQQPGRVPLSSGGWRASGFVDPAPYPSCGQCPDRCPYTQPGQQGSLATFQKECQRMRHLKCGLFVFWCPLLEINEQF